MDKNGMFGEMLEKGQQTVQKTVKSAVSDVTNSVAGQLGVKPEASPDALVGKAQPQTQQQQPQKQVQPPSESSMPQASSSPETVELVKEFYAPSDDKSAVNAKNPQQEQAETQAKLAKLRQELHQTEYYDPLIAYETKKPQEEEEGAAQRVEKQEKEEEQKKMQLEEKKAKETQDLATSRAQRAVEANRGVAG